MADAFDVLRVLLASLVATGVIARLFLPRAQAAGSGLLLVGAGGLIATVAPASVRGPMVIVPALLVAAAALLAGARLFGGGTHATRMRIDIGRRSWLLLAGAAVLPLRVPLTIADERYNLLLPLYAVLALAGARLFLDDLADARAGRTPTRHQGPWAVDIGVAGFIVAATLSASWSIDIDASIEKLALVYAPFAVLYIVLRAWLPGLGLRAFGLAFVAVLAVAAGVGIWQHATETVWQNAKVIVANTYAPNFRTNSIFWDPNIYGRYLVAALTAVATYWVTMQGPVRTWLRSAGLAALGALLATGLWFTYSQSSLVALAVAALVLAVVLLPIRLRLLVLVALIAGAVMLPTIVDQLRGRDEQTRRNLVVRGLALAAERPIAGVGVGAFEHGVRVMSEDRGEEDLRQTASHTTPITILAELGVLGAAAYLLVLTAAGAIAVAGAAHARGVALGFERGRSPAARWWAGATFAGVTAHSMFYAGFFEDPLVWACLGLLAASASSRDAIERKRPGSSPRIIARQVRAPRRAGR